jgi:outer membrane protein TolC
MMKKFLIIFLSASFLGLAPLIYAQENKAEHLRINIKQAIDMALDASEDLQLQDNEVKRKSSERKEEKSSLFPKITGEARWSNNFEYPDIAATAATKEYHVNTGLTVNQTVFTFGRISNAISAAQRALEASRFDKEGTKQSVIYNTKIAFYNAYLAQRTLDIAEESYRNALKNKEILEDRASGGRASKYDNIKIAADIASRKPTVNNARADFLSAMETLKVIIGAESNDSIKLVADFNEEYPDFVRQDMALALYNNQPAIKSLEKSIKEKEALIKSKKAMLLPEVSAFATWNHKGDSNDSYVGNDNLDDYGVAGLKVSIPIWMGGISREKLYQAKLDQEDAKLKYQQGKEEYLLMLDKAINEYREYKKTLEANKEAISLAEESFKYSQEIFGSGQVSVTDLNDAELQLTHAKIGKEITLFNLNSTLARIERLTLMGKNNE